MVVVDELVQPANNIENAMMDPRAKERDMQSYLTRSFGKRCMSWRTAMMMPAVAAAGIALCAASSPPTPAPHVIILRSQSSAGIHGTATLTSLGSKTKVTIVLVEDPPGAQHPAHIHAGTCADFNVVPRYPIETVVNGRSVTIVQAPLADLIGHGLVLEIHSSKYHVNVIAACGALQ
jgi:hypothetical protein